jgi:hypothetical protein
VSVIYETTRQPIVIFFVCIGEAWEKFSSAGFLSCYPPGSLLCKDQKREYLKSDHQTTRCPVLYLLSNFFDDVIKDPLFDKGQFIP